MQPTQPTEPQAVIRLNQLRFSYPGATTEVLNIPEWQLNQGERCFVFGASGAGKSTLMNLLSGVLKPSSGEIWVQGENLSALSSKKRDQFRARHIGVVFQQFNLIPYLTVAENIRLASWFSGFKEGALGDSFEERLAQLLETLQLPLSVLQRPSGELSVGQQQRVAIVRALINQPELVIVDEPTSALDTYARDSFMQLLMSTCSAQASSLLFVSHDLALQSYFDVHLALGELNQAKGELS